MCVHQVRVANVNEPHQGIARVERVKEVKETVEEIVKMAKGTVPINHDHHHEASRKKATVDIVTTVTHAKARVKATLHPGIARRKRVLTAYHACTKCVLGNAARMDAYSITRTKQSLRSVRTNIQPQSLQP